jgi:hypothetical protein
MTLEPIPYAQGPVRVALENDRRGWLIAFGVLNLLVGTLASCSTVGMLAAVAVAAYFQARTPAGGNPFQGLGPAEMIAGLTFYLLAAVLFVWSGIDSIRCRRWVRPVLIAVGWIAIVSSSFYVAFSALAFNDISRAMAIEQAAMVPPAAPAPATTTSSTTTPATPAPAPLSPAQGNMILLSMMCGAAVAGIILPGLYVWFYSRPSVRRTLEAYDPRLSWADRCPLPLFVACAGLVFGTTSVGPAAPYATAPFFGGYVRGVPAVTLTLATAVAMLLAALLVYRQSVAGWWLAFTVIVLGFASVLTTLWASGPLEFYRINHIGQEQLDAWQGSAVMNGPLPLAFTGAVGAVCVGYLIWVRRYFRPDTRAGAAPVG